MPSYVDVVRFAAAAPAEHRHLFDCQDVFPMYRRWYEQEAFLLNLMGVAGMDECIKRPYSQEQSPFSIAQQKSDIKELAGLRAGLWVYYEGGAGTTRGEQVLGWVE